MTAMRVSFKNTRKISTCYRVVSKKLTHVAARLHELYAVVDVLPSSQAANHVFPVILFPCHNSCAALTFGNESLTGFVERFLQESEEESSEA